MRLPRPHVLSAGYRVFFLLAGLFAVVAMIVWEGWLAIHAAGGMVTGEPFAMAPHLWHAHEMVFGYSAAVIAGFLLTATPNWTGTRPASARFLAPAAALWLAGRLAVWWSGSLPPALVALVDLAFLPLVAGLIVSLLLRRPKPKQLVLLAVIALVWAGNLLVHLEWTGLTSDTAYTGLRGGLMALALLIVILGGRVTPAFTRNAMQRAGWTGALPRDPLPLAVAAIAGTALTAAAQLAGAPDAVAGALAALAGLAALARLAFWQGGWTRAQPILWTLHLSYLTTALGLMLYAAALWGLLSEVAALHVLGIGAVGGMTLSVMSRAALGHSGRALSAPGGLALAYALVPAVTLLRFAGSAWPGFYFAGVLASGALWIAVFTLYLATLWPVFWQASPTPAEGASA
ncbi:MAG: NnrS family protein [Roseivivax sp.]|nr:NnrS family protein [Roseivivax sp.]